MLRKRNWKKQKKRNRKKQKKRKKNKKKKKRKKKRQQLLANVTSPSSMAIHLRNIITAPPMI